VLGQAAQSKTNDVASGVPVSPPASARPSAPPLALGPHGLHGVEHERFDVIARLGAGGMGVVYKAFDRELHEYVALKTLTRVEAGELVRFKGEFRALVDLRHPNWVRFGELFEAGGRWFFTMELVEGTDFLSHVRGRRTAAAADETMLAPTALESRVAPPLPDAAFGATLDADARGDPVPYDEARFRSALAELARGLHALHAVGKVHRDVKPSNLMVTPAGRVVLLDFGLVTDARTVRGRRTADEHLGGTVAYMAPEQVSPTPVGPAADWYAVGAMMYEVLTGEVPFTGSVSEILARKQREPARRPATFRASVPADLEALCMDLLQVDAAARPPGEEILRRLRAGVAQGLDEAPSDTIVGRDGELEDLALAFAAARRGRGSSVFVAGESGSGKSALVRAFAEQILDDRPDTVLLTGRCYEGEWVPFKAFDGVVDALSTHLARMPRAEVEELLPEQSNLLALAFLVLKRVEAIAEAPAPDRDVLDARELRARVFAALRELLSRLAARVPVVIVIDDLQWADSDSFALLRELLREPGAPALFLIATQRVGAGEVPAEPHALLGAPLGALGAVRQISVVPLSDEHARALAQDLLGPGSGAAAASLAAESRGHPLFLKELVIHHRQHRGAATAAPLRLDEALWHRVERLDPLSRRLLSSVALAGRLTQDVAARAADLSPGDYAQHAGGLRAASLVRTAGRRGSDAIEPYHDRVREAVVAHLSAETRRSCHVRVALALEAIRPDDHEALAVHWRGAGDERRAKDHAIRAAARAEEALAFDRAGQLYALALELGPDDCGEIASLQRKRGEALANAGRGADAAAAFLAAAAPADRLEALDLQRRAADQLLRSGHIDAALATFRVVLEAVGMKMPGSKTWTLVVFLLCRARIRLRGLSFRETEDRLVAPEELTRIDACWSASAGLGLVDTIVGQYFQARGLLLALRAGEPRRAHRALAMEAAYGSAAGGKTAARTAAILSRARALGEALGDPYGLAFTTLSEGCAAALQGRWKHAYTSCERAESAFRERCPGTTWETETLRWFSLWSLAYLGDVAELGRRVPARLREAEERGDLYAGICHSTGLANLAWLAADDPPTARARSREALNRWSKRTFHVEHWWAMLSDRQIDLYLGDAEAAYAAVRAEWSSLHASLLLMVQLTRIEALHLRARSALALARVQPRRRSSLCREAERDAARIARERMPWSNPLAGLLRAGTEATRGDDAAAEVLLRDAIRGLEACDMALYAAAARLQCGGLVGGDEGRALAATAERWMRAQGVVDPSRMAAMLAPGFTERRRTPE
jgi:serine/threonine protein kinase